MGVEQVLAGKVIRKYTGKNPDKVPALKGISTHIKKQIFRDLARTAILDFDYDSGVKFLEKIGESDSAQDIAMDLASEYYECGDYINLSKIVDAADIELNKEQLFGEFIKLLKEDFQQGYVNTMSTKNIRAGFDLLEKKVSQHDFIELFALAYPEGIEKRRHSVCSTVEPLLLLYDNLEPEESAQNLTNGEKDTSVELKKWVIDPSMKRLADELFAANSFVLGKRIINALGVSYSYNEIEASSGLLWGGNIPVNMDERDKENLVSSLECIAEDENGKRRINDVGIAKISGLITGLEYRGGGSGPETGNYHLPFADYTGRLVDIAVKCMDSERKDLVARSVIHSLTHRSTEDATKSAELVLKLTSKSHFAKKIKSYIDKRAALDYNIANKRDVDDIKGLVALGEKFNVYLRKDLRVLNAEINYLEGKRGAAAELKILGYNTSALSALKKCL